MSIDPGEDYGKQIDLSGLDFDLIEKEFLKSTKKNTIVQDLKNKVKEKLDEMLDQNPLRMQYYEKYQEIIELYNLGKDYASIKEILIG